MRFNHPDLHSLPVCFALTMGVLCLPTQALDLTLIHGQGSRHNVDKSGLIVGWHHPRPIWQGRSWQLQLRHEAEISRWNTHTVSNVVEVGYSPVLRLQRTTGDLPRGFYAEASIGVRLLSSPRIHATQTLSTAFQFNDMLGLGYQWGERGQHTVGLRLQHVSNAGIKRPNPGINFTTAFYRYRF